MHGLVRHVRRHAVAYLALLVVAVSGSAYAANSSETQSARTAYALIRVPVTGAGDGVLDRAYSKGVKGIRYSRTVAAGGGYCIALGFTPRNIQVTNAEPGHPAPGAYLALVPSQCPVGYRAAAALANTTVWVLMSR